MEKIVFKPGTMLSPVPVVMVSCGCGDEKNVITIAWTGIINSDPPMTYISVRKERYSHSILEKNREFVINLTTEALAFAADYCGVKSGRDVDKFKAQQLTPTASQVVKCPSIGESPVNIECRVVEVREYATHDMFIAEIVSVSAEAELMDEKGKLHLENAGLIAYSHGQYFPLQKRALGRFGYSVMKPKTRKRLAAGQRNNNSIRKSRRRK